jgi:hypothetical protein
LPHIEAESSGSIFASDQGLLACFRSLGEQALDHQTTSQLAEPQAVKRQYRVRLIGMPAFGLMMTATMAATMESATVEPATMEPATVVFAAMEFATMEFATMVEFAAMESVTVEFAEAFAADSAIAPVRGIAVAVASVIPTSVGTSRQVEGRNQKRN